VCFSSHPFSHPVIFIFIYFSFLGSSSYLLLLFPIFHSFLIAFVHISRFLCRFSLVFSSLSLLSISSSYSYFTIMPRIFQLTQSYIFYSPFVLRLLSYILLTVFLNLI
jgi:hypothetical protein